MIQVTEWKFDAGVAAASSSALASLLVFHEINKVTKQMALLISLSLLKITIFLDTKNIEAWT
ncbi:hypothetical protein OA79_08820 [Marinomonas sp. TW1]|nr:hypothetical protein OA79_08820 [Marinomonas sp. TW1]